MPEQRTANIESILYPVTKYTLSDTKHRDVKYLNNAIEHVHEGIKFQIRSMKGFCGFYMAPIFCTASEEIRQMFPMKNES